MGLAVRCRDLSRLRERFDRCSLGGHDRERAGPPEDARHQVDQRGAWEAGGACRHLDYRLADRQGATESRRLRSRPRCGGGR